MISQKVITLPFVDILRDRLQEPTPLMQFVIGPRQVGKTTGIEILLKNLAPTSVHYVLAEDSYVRSASWLKEQWWYAQSLPGSPILIVDEVQKIDKWAETIKFLWDHGRKEKKILKCVFLGSSSLHILTGVTESLAGRYEFLRVPHWDFELSQKLLPQLSFQDFLKYGGYPGAYQFLKSNDRWHQYVRDSIVENILTKDIFSVHIIKKPALFRQMIELLAAYPAQVLSYNKLLGQLQESGNVEIIKHYLRILENSFLFTSLEKYSPKKVLQKSSSPKIIPLCPALISILAPEVSLGRRFESYIGSVLLRLDGEVWYWKDRDYEVDFIFKNKKGNKFAIEVKSGRKKHSRSLEQLLAREKSLVPLIIDVKNFLRLPELVAK